MKIWIDADSCPVRVREIIEKAALRTGTQLIMVANRKIPHRQSPLISDIIVNPNMDEADDHICEAAAIHDIVITRDIPLAGRLVKNGITVINDRGSRFTTENIGERLSIRNFMKDIRESGLKTDEETTISARDIQKFSNTFDSILTKMIKTHDKID